MKGRVCGPTIDRVLCDPMRRVDQFIGKRIDPDFIEGIHKSSLRTIAGEHMDSIEKRRFTDWDKRSAMDAVFVFGNIPKWR